jgi:cell division protein FtsB
LTLLLRILKFASKLPGTPTPLIPYPCVTRGAFVNPFHWEIRRTMRRRVGILFVVAFVSMLGAAACGGVQEQVQEQVDQEVQGVQDQAEEAVQGGRTQIEEQIQEGQTQVEEAIEGQ